MDNINEILKVKKMLINDLTKLKLKRYYSLIEDGEFKEQILDIYDNSLYSTEIEMQSFLAFREVLKRVERLECHKVDFEIFIDEEVTFITVDEDGTRICDVIIISDEGIEVIELMPTKVDPIAAYYKKEMKLLGLGAINTFKHLISGDKITLIAVQPNIFTVSINEMNIEELVHESMYSLM